MTVGGRYREDSPPGKRQREPPFDTPQQMLADHYRRGVLEALDREGETSIESVARRLTERDFQGSGVPPTEADYCRTRAELARIHVPQLIEAGLVARDGERHSRNLASGDDDDGVISSGDTGDDCNGDSGGNSADLLRRTEHGDRVLASIAARATTCRK